MSDNTTLNTGSGGDTIATDELTTLNGGAVSGVKAQRVKVGFGSDGSFRDVDTSNGLPVSDGGSTLSVDDGSSSLTVDNGGTFAVQENGAALTALQLLDDTVYTDGTGTPSKAIGIAGTDGTNPQIVKTDSSGELQVDVLTLPNVTIGAALPAGTNNIGDVDVASIAAGDNNIGNVDVVTLPNLNESLVDDAAFTPGSSRVLPIGATLDDNTPDTVNEGDIGALRMTADRAMHTSLRDSAGNNRGANVDANNNLNVIAAANSGVDIGDVTINNSTGGSAVNIQDGGNSITVDDGASSLTVDNGGTFVVQENGAALTALQLIDNIVTTEDTASQSGDSGIVAFARRTASPANTSDTDGDYEALQVSAGRLWTSATVDAALPAGTNAIGKLAANSGVDIGDVDVASVIAGTGATNLGKAEDAAHTTGDTGVAILGVRRDTAASGADTNGDYATINLDANGRLYTNDQAAGDVAHDGADSGNPVKVGAKAIAHGTNPTAVAAADRTDLYANRAGVLFVIGGHPNVVTLEAAYTSAQTDAAIVTISTGLKIVVTQIQFTADNANSVDVGFRVGFGTANTPTTTGVVLTHPGVAAGSGVSRGDGSGIIGIGADNEDLRITSEVPTGGSVRVLVSYYTIES